MVERRTPNPDVGGSNPSWPANVVFELFSNEILGVFSLGQVRQEANVAMAASTKLKKTNAVKNEEPSPFSPAEIKKFVNEVKAEFFKIVWPDKKTTLGLTGIVVTLTIVLSLYLGSVDLLIGKLIGFFLR